MIPERREKEGAFSEVLVVGVVAALEEA